MGQTKAMPQGGNLNRRIVLAMVTTMLILVVLSACVASSPKPAELDLKPISALPEAMQHAPTTVRSAYQFAISYPEALDNVECYCGCGAVGHTSNLSCYVSSFDIDGVPVMDDHAMGCSICVDITLDVMRMTTEERAPAAIRKEIIAAYSKFGPPTP
jgi:hypothetical protein